ncbi:S-adenosyl-L-methionine-dependent methyltransferase [Chaetomium fimeti]|uniref:S-adenosyl-L-methionine-dependent methyltransferase n=1 Tax=Chaetomium fimeti TaxID=1854472 RepID=A0AAE0LUV3_9PEZI|nr:S-adenosyl-L-methionine-dependent methyltransferase [Chaetomium fimeti]
MSAPSDHHHHHHHDHHHHGNGASATEENQEYFNKLAAEYDSRHEKTLGKLIEEIRARVDFIGVDWADEDDEDNNGGDGGEKKDVTAKKSVRLLDYACGTGVVSRALAPYTTQCVGIDLSENMVAAYNTRAENQGLAASEMHAYQGNICDPDEPNPEALASAEFSEFDIAAVGLGFHHFDDPSLAARRLAERLKTGGVLMILDFLPHGKMGDSHPALSTVTHHGFSEEHIRRIYEEAGVGKDFGLEEMAVVFNFSKEKNDEVRRKIFIARGTKA